MTKLKTYVTAVFTAIVLALLCLVPVVSGSSFTGYASADDAPVDPEPPMVIYEQLYYFSDSEICEERFSYIQDYLQEYDSLINEQNEEGADAHYTESHLIDLSYHTYESLTKNIGSEILSYYNISDSFIIFELSNIKLYNMSEGEFECVLAENLCDIFSVWEQNDCKIMLINDTDEEYFESYIDKYNTYHYNTSALLDYVDIHVNTDVFYEFITNVLYKAGNNSFELDGCTIILDRSLSQNIMYENPMDNFVIAYHIACCLPDATYKDIYNAPENAPENLQVILDFANVKILCYTGNGFYDPIAATIPTGDELDQYFTETAIHVIGTSELGYNEVNSFFNYMFNLIGTRGVSDSTSYYFYNPDNYSINRPVSFQAGNTLAEFEDILSQIIYDFIMGNDLTCYDNYPSARCEVTYKPVTFGDDGWMCDMRAEHKEVKDEYLGDD